MAEKPNTPKNTPYGLSISKNELISNKQELVIRKEIFEVFADCQRKETTARIINEKGYRNRNDAEFTDVSIGRILSAPQIDIREIDSEQAELFVSDELYNKVQNILALQNSENSPSRMPVHPFSGKVICGHCGTKMRVLSSLPEKFTCQSCRRKIDKNDLEQVFKSQLKQISISPEIVSQFSSNNEENIKEKYQQISVLNNEQKKVSQQLKRNHHLYLNEKISLEQFEKTQSQLEERNEQIAKSVKQLHKQIQQYEQSSPTPAQEQTLYERWDSFSDTDKIQFIESSTERIVILGQEIDITFYFLPSLGINDGNLSTDQPQVKEHQTVSEKPPEKSASTKQITTKKEKRVPIALQAIEELFGTITPPDTLQIGDGEVNRIFQCCKKLERDKAKKEQVFNIAFSTFLRTQGYWSYIKSCLPFEVTEVPPRKRK